MSTLNGGPGNIVTNGLVLYLDAANYQSYVSGSTTWRDLSSSNLSGSLINGPTFNSGNAGSIVFDGTNDYTMIPYTSLLTPTLLSCNVWAYSNNWSSNTGNQKIFSKTQVGGYALGCAVFTGNSLEFIMYIDGNYRYATYPLSSIGVGWNNFQGTFDGRYVKLYINGVLVNTYDNTSTSIIAYSDSNNFIVAAEPGSGASIDGNYFNGRIATTQIYNRALTASEVLQNYNATKRRFGL